ncbi:MAG: DUF2791 family P-loop domain-containing protein [Anaerolineae bacterium]|nr:DUF2791 family P-loop domain-containing protein [Anaerolineae bacterium]
MRLELSLLGSFRAYLDDAPVTGFPSDKARALLAYLALESDRPHRREALAEMLWPDRSTADGLGNLRSLLSRLRQAITDHQAWPPFLLITRQAIQLNPESHCHTDVEDLAASDPDRLREAVAAYRGRLLEGLSVRDSPAFEEWVLLKQEEVERRYLWALARLSDHCQAQGDYREAEGYARRQLELEPWREEAHRQLMRALCLSGQRSAALAQYQVCLRVLQQELGAPPAPETIALYDSIRQRPMPGPAMAPIPPPTIVLPEDLPEDQLPPFVGRERELAQLGRYLEKAVSGQGQVAFVVGEPGSGKTMLLHEFAHRALETYPELVVASGSGNAYTGTGDPYLPFLDLLRMLTGDVQARHSQGAVTREQAQRLWQMVPQAAQAVVAHGPALLDVFVPAAPLLARARSVADSGNSWVAALEEATRRKGSTPPQPQLFEQFTQVVQTLARGRPLLLTVDDLQWADRGSIELLFHLGRRLADSPILLLGAYRPGEVALGREGERHPLEPVANELRSQYGTAPVDLDRAEGRRFLEALLDRETNRLPAQFRDTLYHHTGGHPLFTVELLQDLRERGGLVRDDQGCWREGPGLDWEGLPTRLEAVIGERVGRLPPQCRQMLEVASLEGEEFTAEVVARVLEVPALEIVHRLSGELARRHQLVRAQSLEHLDGQRLSRYRFRHYLFQRYLYQSLDRVEQAHLHEAVGRAQEEIWGEAADEMALQLAWHYEEAGLALMAAGAYLRAGDQAQWMAAMPQAEIHYRKGLALMATLPEEHRDVQTEMRLQTGLCVAAGLTRSAASPDLTPLYERALELCQRAGDAQLLLQVLAELEYHHEVRADYDRALEILAQAFGPLLTRGDPYALTWVHGLLGRVLRLLGHFGPARVHLETAAAWTASHSEEFAAPAWPPGLWWHLARVLGVLGYPEQGLRRCEELRQMAERLGHPAMLAMARGRTAWYRYELHREERTLDEWTAASATFQRETGGEWRDATAFRRAYRGEVLLHRGQAVEGSQHIRAAVEALVRDGFLYDVPEVLVWLAEAYLGAGRPDAGLNAAALGLRLVRRTSQRFAESSLHRAMGDLHRQRGRPHDEWLAEARYLSALDVARRQEAKLFELQAATALARLWRDQGKRKEAHDLLAGVYDWFTEGFEAYDLKQARALLQELT